MCVNSLMKEELWNCVLMFDLDIRTSSVLHLVITLKSIVCTIIVTETLEDLVVHTSCFCVATTLIPKGGTHQLTRVAKTASGGTLHLIFCLLAFIRTRGQSYFSITERLLLLWKYCVVQCELVTVCTVLNEMYMCTPLLWLTSIKSTLVCYVFTL